MSYRQFLRTDFGESRHAEWVDGEVVFMAPVSSGNIDLQGFLISVLRTYVEAKDLGKVLFEPYVMKTGPDLPGRSPDVMVVGTQRCAKIKKLELQGPADLVVEIVSRGSNKRDKKDKYREYQQGGVNEYWILDPLRQTAEFYSLNRQRLYARMAEDEQGIVRSRVLPGLWLKVNWLWQTPLPSVTSVLKEWGIM